MKKQFTADSIEEAAELAVKEFGVEKDRITFTTIDEGKKGILGFGKAQAVVEAEYEPTKTETALEYLAEVLSAMGVDAELVAEEGEEGAVIDIQGDMTGTVIGRRGETLDALQYLASMAANKSDKDYYRISLDSCGYREKRKAILEELAKKIAKTVQRTGRSTTLEPMNPYERRIIHATIGDIEGVTSKSVGEEPYRKVVISSTNPRKFEHKGERGGRHSGGRGRGGYDKGSYDKGYDKGGFERKRDPHSMDLMKTSFEKDYKKPRPEDNLLSGDLYGRLDIDY
ncbi:MAG: protein jag [Oscillospiraceae bacterium]|nr:protein jag [Oscillospiraceae bacterium]